jgi:hypothetical protein
MPMRQPELSSSGPPLLPARCAGGRAGGRGGRLSGRRAAVGRHAAAAPAGRTATRQQGNKATRQQGNKATRQQGSSQRRTRVDGGVCLDDVLDGAPADGLDLAPRAADDARGEGVVEAWGDERARVEGAGRGRPEIRGQGGEGGEGEQGRERQPSDAGASRRPRQRAREPRPIARLTEGVAWRGRHIAGGGGGRGQVSERGRGRGKSAGGSEAPSTQGHAGARRGTQGHAGARRRTQGHAGTRRGTQGHAGARRGTQGHAGGLTDGEHLLPHHEVGRRRAHAEGLEVFERLGRRRRRRGDDHDAHAVGADERGRAAAAAAVDLHPRRRVRGRRGRRPVGAARRVGARRARRRGPHARGRARAAGGRRRRRVARIGVRAGAARDLRGAAREAGVQARLCSKSAAQQGDS